MRHSSQFRLHPFALAIAVLFTLAVSAVALAQQALTVQLDPMNGSTVSGTIVLTADGDATDATLDLTGMAPGADGTATLYANTCEQPSASFATVAQFTSDADGNVHATGRVLYQNTDVSFASISDGDRIISVASGDQVVACGSVPAAESPAALPGTGGTFDFGLYALLGVFGLMMLLGGLSLARFATKKTPR